MNLTIDLPRELESAAAARQAIGDLSPGLPDDLVGDVRLLVSELVTNALRHASLRDEDTIKLTVSVSSSRVRVEVLHPGEGFEAPDVPTDPEAVEGWGLYLVATLADRWGVVNEAGTRVWFELDIAPEGSQAAA